MISYVDKISLFEADLIDAIEKRISTEWQYFGSCWGNLSFNYHEMRFKATYGSPFIALLIDKQPKYDERKEVFFYFYRTQNRFTDEQLANQIKHDHWVDSNKIIDCIATHYGIPVKFVCEAMSGYNNINHNDITRDKKYLDLDMEDDITEGRTFGKRLRLLITRCVPLQQ